MKKVLFSIITMILITTVLLGAVELLSRIFIGDSSYHVHPLSEFQHDPIVGWKGIPGWEGASPLSNSHISINKDGFRDTDWNEVVCRANEQQLTKILFLGDSCTYGFEIDLRERLSEQLKSLHLVNNREVITFNAGIPAFGTCEEFRVFERLAPVLNPDVILLQFSANDFGDSCLPYCWGDYQYRVYRPFYDVHGHLMLNETVPQRFSIRVRGTMLENFRARFLVDKLETLIDNIRYSRLGISENRRIPLEQPFPMECGMVRHVLDMGLVGYHPGFKDIYEKNKSRNFALWKKMNALCADHSRQFFMLTDFSGHPEPDHPQSEIISFLQKNRIKFLDLSRSVAEYHPWGYVNYDGHPNFVTNYLQAINLYNGLQDANVRPDFRSSSWYADLSPEIDFQRGDFHKYLFGGNWDRKKEIQNSTRGRWLNGEAKFLLRCDNVSGNTTVRVDGISPVSANSITLHRKGLHAPSRAEIQESGWFQVCFEISDPVQEGILFMEILPEHPVFISRIIQIRGVVEN